MSLVHERHFEEVQRTLERGKGVVLTDAQIKHMVDRFLGWKLPDNFNPDDGISFDPILNRGHVFQSRRTPSGTNLFDATQADAMVRFMLEGLPAA